MKTVEVGPSELICTTFVNENKSMNRDTNERKINGEAARTGTDSYGGACVRHFLRY